MVFRQPGYNQANINSKETQRDEFYLYFQLFFLIYALYFELRENLFYSKIVQRKLFMLAYQRFSKQPNNSSLSLNMHNTSKNKQ